MGLYTDDARSLKENNVPFVIKQSSYLYCRLSAAFQYKVHSWHQFKGHTLEANTQKWFGKR